MSAIAEQAPIIAATEAAALWLKSSGVEQWFAWYVAGMVAIGLVALLTIPDTRRYGYLEGSGQVEKRARRSEPSA